jgi:hypothetical protein
VLGQVVLFAEEYRQAAAGRIGGDADTVDAAPDYGQVIDFSEGSSVVGVSRHGGTGGRI